jgi:hypothetical protein
MWPSLSPYPLPASFFSAVVYDFATTVADGGQERASPAPSTEPDSDG